MNARISTRVNTQHAAMQQAAEWFALLRSGAASESDQRAWQAWLAQKSEHRDAWAYAETIARRFEPVRAPDTRRAAVEALHGVRQVSLSRRRVLGAIAVLGGGALLGLEFWRQPPQLARTLLAQYRTGTGEMLQLALADGSTVWLNTASALDTDFSTSRRQLQLWQGEMLVQTAHEAHRSFVVDTAHGRMRALGTRFAVRLLERETLLAVFEGAVEVHNRTGATRVIAAGSQVRFDGSAIAAVQPADAARQAWSRGVLLAENMRLDEVLAELSRYHHGHFGTAPEVAHLRVLGGYPLHDAERTMAMLAAVLPVRVRRTLPWWTTLEPA